MKLFVLGSAEPGSAHSAMTSGLARAARLAGNRVEECWLPSPRDGAVELSALSASLLRGWEGDRFLAVGVPAVFAPMPNALVWLDSIDAILSAGLEAALALALRGRHVLATTERCQRELANGCGLYAQLVPLPDITLHAGKPAFRVAWQPILALATS